MIKIVLYDPRGGVLSVSKSLMVAFNKHELDCSMLNMSEFGGGFFTRLYISIRYFFKESRDIQLILQHFDAIFLGLFLKLFGFKRVINVVHIDLVEYYSSVGLFKKIIISLMFYLIKSDLVVFVSREAELRAVRKFNLKKTYTIYNIFDFPPARACIPTSERSGSVTLGVVSRLHKVKNVDLAVKVVHAMRQKNIDVSLNIYGGGSDEEISKINELVRLLKVDQSIRYCGVVNNKDEIFNTIDGLISFSSIEGLPTVIIESIGYRVPVFYTDCCSGPRELMSPQSDVLKKTTSYQRTEVGYLVRPVVGNKNYESMLDTYVEYLSNFVVDINNSNFSMSFDENRFSSTEVVRQWKNVICA